MAPKGNARHMKRMNAPPFIKLPRKTFKFVIKASAGPHPVNHSLPLGYIVRDVLKLAATGKEVKYILNGNKVLVDGKVRTQFDFPVGIMDVIEIPELNKCYRVLPSRKVALTLSEITKAESKFKLCRIDNISTIKKGNLQLNLHDGRNITIKVDDVTKKPEIPYKTRGTLKISLPDQKIMDFYPMQQNSQAIVWAGKNMGLAGKISNVIKRFGVNASIAVIDAGENNTFSTLYDYAFIIGKDKPSIDLPRDE